jgi:chromosome partitioning protein
MVVAVTNQKGGCGKTTTAVNLAAGLLSLCAPRRVLIVDLDPQGSVANCLNLSLTSTLLPIATALKQRQLQHIIQATSVPGLDIAPGDSSLDVPALQNEPRRDFIVQKALAPVLNLYDWIILDTPPNLEIVTCNALVAADFLVIPCDVDRETLGGLKHTIEIAGVYLEDRPEVDPVAFCRVLVSMYDHRDQVVNAWFEQLIEPLGPQLFETRIKRATALKKARANGLTIFQYAEQNSAARSSAAEFSMLAHEVYDHARTHYHVNGNPDSPTA